MPFGWIRGEKKTLCTRFQPHPHRWTSTRIRYEPCLRKGGNLILQGLDCRQVVESLTPVPQVCPWLHWQCVLGHCYVVGVRVFDWPMPGSALSKLPIFAADVGHKGQRSQNDHLGPVQSATSPLEIPSNTHDLFKPLLFDNSFWSLAGTIILELMKDKGRFCSFFYSILTAPLSSVLADYPTIKFSVPPNTWIFCIQCHIPFQINIKSHEWFLIHVFCLFFLNPTGKIEWFPIMKSQVSKY